MEHIKITIEIKKYRCCKCGKYFNSGYLLNKHEKECNSTNNISTENNDALKVKIHQVLDKIINEFN